MAARNVSFKGMVASPRIVGVASAGFPIASLFNRTGSGVLVAVRRLSLQNDYTTNTGTVRTLLLSPITTNVTTGTLHTPVAFDTSQTHQALVEFRSSASADGTASTITATAGTKAWVQYPMHLADLTSTGQVVIDDTSIAPNLANQDPIILAEGEGLLINAVETPSTSQHFIVNLMFEEFTYAAAPPIPNMAPYVAFTQTA